MIAEICFVPLGQGSHLSQQLAPALQLIHDSGLVYKLNPMGTCVEGSWEEIVDLVKRCQDRLLEDNERVMTTVKWDAYRDAERTMASKIASVTERSERPLKT